MRKILLFGMTQVLIARDPFVYATQEIQGPLVTAQLHEHQQSVYFSINDERELQIALQEKSPSTFCKAEGLGG